MLNLSKDAREYLRLNFNTERVGYAILGNNAYGGPETIKLFKNGKACHFLGWNVGDALWFDNHQDCLDFLMIK